MRKQARETKRLLTETLEAAGAAFEFLQGSKHEQVYVTTADGRKFTMPFAGSPGDHRAVKNLLTGLKRQLHAPG